MTPPPVPSPAFSPAADRRNALDRAHIGDIEGAFGTVRTHDTAPRRSTRGRLLTLLAVAGPGLVVMAADNDAGTISVFSQAGQDHGLWMLCSLLVLCPALYVTQEMAVRLGTVTGAGHARLILERFGRLWCAFSLLDLLALNIAMLLTEFIGVALSLGYLGVSRTVSVPLAAIALVAVTAGGSFRRWERTMCALILVDVVIVPLALAGGIGHAAAGGLAVAVSSPRHRPAGGDGQVVLLLVALIGTTIAPWQLFFQQSNVVDKRITPRWLNYARADTAIGAVLFSVCAAGVLIVSATAVSGSSLRGRFTDIGEVIRAVASGSGSAAGVVFAVLLLNASLLGAAAVSLSGSYAIGEVFGFKHSLHRSCRDARVFHASFAVAVAASAGTVLIPGLALGAVTTFVQALTGMLLPCALVLLLLLCNDEHLLGPLRNGPVRNLIAGATIAMILSLSTVLTLKIAVPVLSLGADLTIVGAIVAMLAVPLSHAAYRRLRGGRVRTGRRLALSSWEARTWSSPPLELLAPPAPARSRVLVLALTRGYVLVIVTLLLLRAGRLPLG